MPVADFYRRLPKVELHVHLEGSIRPETLLKLAQKNKVSLPAQDLDGLRAWYQFRDFPHFVEIYVAISKCIQDADDIELVAREFLQGQAAQNILHSEVTYTASTIEKYMRIPWEVQLEALRRAIAYGKSELGVSMGLIVDIVRGDDAKRGLEVAEWISDVPEVLALGLAGEERLGSNQYVDAFTHAMSHGKPVVPHAGETCGPESIEEMLKLVQPKRIGHGVRAIEKPMLMNRLAKEEVVLEVCPSSNVSLGVFPSLEAHPLPRLMDAGISVTINSDDPPMFGTTLSDEFERCAKAFDFDEDICWSLCLNAANASLLPEAEKKELVRRMNESFRQLR